ncbi:hypothetical protein [uncultured Veillonella sp.]|uniref:hypothetical protein n=1 Tax=uncultured Veillonella sp. TaxID=159268 RepID=UPI002803E320|nr:hypothetical protein [uncultured Veillonella sp.]
MNINILLSRRFPVEKGAAVIDNFDGSYTMVINSHLCEEKRKTAILHELTHIRRGDLNTVDIEANIIETLVRRELNEDNCLDGINFFYHVID